MTAPLSRPEVLSVTHNYPVNLIPRVLRESFFRDMREAGICSIVLSAGLLEELLGN